MTPSVDDGASIEEALTRIMEKMSEKNDQTSIRMSELERAAHVERENLRLHINRNIQEVSQSGSA